MNGQEQTAMTLMIHAGEAKSCAMEAIAYAKEGQLDQANQAMQAARQQINLAHKGQTGLLTAEASGDKVVPSLLLIHAQDHLMTAISFIDLAKELVDVYNRLTIVIKEKNS